MARKSGSICRATRKPREKGPKLDASGYQPMARHVFRQPRGPTAEAASLESGPRLEGPRAPCQILRKRDTVDDCPAFRGKWKGGSFA